MICSNCKKEVSKITTIYIKGTKIEFCKYCKNNFDIPENEDYKHTMHFGEGGKYTIGVAHFKDIKSRRLDLSTGEVIRDKGRKFI